MYHIIKEFSILFFPLRNAVVVSLMEKGGSFLRCQLLVSIRIGRFYSWRRCVIIQ